MKKFNIIYIDPPWTYKDKALSGRRGAGCKYDLMAQEEIKNLPVNKITANDCFLFIWVTMPKLNEVFNIINAYGFTYKTCAFTWIKKNKISNSWFFGMGRWTRSNAELCLLATKGNPKRISASISSIIDTPIEKHSKKPAIIRDKIIKLCGDLPRIELFARDKIDGWYSLGYDVDGRDIRESIKDLF